MNREEILEVLESEFDGNYLISDGQLERVANRILGSEPKEWPSITPQELLEHISTITGCPIEEIKSEGRKRHLVKVRAIYFYLGHDLYNFGPSILALHSNRDHSDVIHHVKKYKCYLERNKPWYREDLDMEIRSIKSKLHEALISCK